MRSGPKAGVISDGATRLHYVYDAWNRLVEVWQDDGDGNLEPNDDTQLAEYRYDGRHRRIAKVDKTGESDVTYDYYYNVTGRVKVSHLWAGQTEPVFTLFVYSVTM